MIITIMMNVMMIMIMVNDDHDNDFLFETWASEYPGKSEWSPYQRSSNSPPWKDIE